MTDSANVKSIEALHFFRASVLKFQENVRLSVSALEMQLLKMMGWLERDRPNFWKREIEKCYREMGEARVRLHKCQMRRVGDFRPTCFEERKDHEKSKKDLEFAQKQIPVVKYWNVCAHHEANEYHGRTSQLTQMLERDIPELLALMNQAIDRLEAYNNVQVPGAAVTDLPDTVEAVDSSPPTAASAAADEPATGEIVPDGQSTKATPASETPETA